MSGHLTNGSADQPTECGLDKIGFRRELTERMIRFSGNVGRFLVKLPPSPSREKLRDQLGRSASSVGANYAESSAAESTRDFVHKLSIALKEAEETNFWLGSLCVEFPDLESEGEALRKENLEFIKILQRSITTARKGMT